VCFILASIVPLVLAIYLKTDLTLSRIYHINNAVLVKGVYRQNDVVVPVSMTYLFIRCYGLTI